MKKVLLVFIAILGFVIVANAQNNAIGVRLGGGQGFNAEVSYQRSLVGFNRLEFDLGYFGSGRGINALGFSAIYQMHFDINTVPNLGWYVGAGLRSFYSHYDNVNVMMIGVLAQAGMDYRFYAVPIQLSLDFRPCFYFWPTTAFQWGDFALGIRYCF